MLFTRELWDGTLVRTESRNPTKPYENPRKPSIHLTFVTFRNVTKRYEILMGYTVKYHQLFELQFCDNSMRAITKNSRKLPSSIGHPVPPSVAQGFGFALAFFATAGATAGAFASTFFSVLSWPPVAVARAVSEIHIYN